MTPYLVGGLALAGLAALAWGAWERGDRIEAEAEAERQAAYAAAMSAAYDRRTEEIAAQQAAVAVLQTDTTRLRDELRRRKEDRHNAPAEEAIDRLLDQWRAEQLRGSADAAGGDSADAAQP
jgi:hypothetical protein